MKPCKYHNTFSIGIGTANCLKFISAIIIAIHHYAQCFVHYVPTSGFGWQILSSQGGYLGVAVFLFLSGYGLMESEKKRHLTLIEFINRRLKKVVFPVAILAILYIPVFYIFNLSYPHTDDTVMDVIVRILNVGGWFVWAIIIMYLVFMVFTYTLKKCGLIKAKVCLIACTILAYIVSDYFLGYFTALSIPIFSVGILASYYKERQHYRIFNHSLIFLIIGAIFSVGYSVYVYKDFVLALHSAINYIFIGMGIIFFTIFSPSIIFPAILGEISFDIYLIHQKIITAYFALNNALIDLIIWIPLTIIAVTAFVIIRKLFWNLIFKRKTSQFKLYDK